MHICKIVIVFLTLFVTLFLGTSCHNEIEPEFGEESFNAESTPNSRSIIGVKAPASGIEHFERAGGNSKRESSNSRGTSKKETSSPSKEI